MSLAAYPSFVHPYYSSFVYLFIYLLILSVVKNQTNKQKQSDLTVFDWSHRPQISSFITGLLSAGSMWKIDGEQWQEGSQGGNGEQVSHRKPSLSKSWQWNVDSETNLGCGWTFKRKLQQNPSKSLWLFDNQDVLGSVVSPTDHGSIELRDDSSCFLRHNKSLWVFSEVWSTWFGLFA